MASIDFNNEVVGLQSSLKPFALKLTRDMDDAEDLIQETMFRAFSNEDKFQSGTKLKAWLYTIMKNIFINNYRKKIKRNTIVDTSDNQYFIELWAEQSEGQSQAVEIDEKDFDQLLNETILPSQIL